MKQFNYLAPKSLPEALAFLAEHGDSAVVFNGGTDVVVRLRDNLIAPEYVIDIKKIPGLDTITFDEKTGLTIGACVTMNEDRRQRVRPEVLSLPRQGGAVGRLQAGAQPRDLPSATSSTPPRWPIPAPRCSPTTR